MTREEWIQRTKPSSRRIPPFSVLLVCALLSTPARSQDPAPALEDELAAVLSQTPLPSR